MSACQVNKIDSNITGLRYAWESCIGVLPGVAAAIAAVGQLTFVGVGLEGKKITIGSVTYTLKAAPTVANDVDIGADAATTAANLAAAINGGAGEGTAYGTGTVEHPDVTAEALLNIVTVTAIVAGIAGNSIATSSDHTDVVAGAATLQDGAEISEGPVWHPLEPNDYADFGGSATTLARNPINPSRQRKKGIVVDLEASGGFNQDLTQANAQDLLQGFMFADTRTKASYTASRQLTVDLSGALPKLVGLTLDTLGLTPGEWIYVGGDLASAAFNADANNGFKRIRSVSATEIVIDKSEEPMVADAVGKVVSLYFGTVLKNELGSLITRRTAQIERTLGSLDGLDPAQSEYLVGAVPSELVLNLANADKITADYSFVAIDNEQRTQAQGLKGGTRPPLVESDAFNTSSDLKRIRLGFAGSDDEAPLPLFGYATELTLTLNNTLSPNKALGVLGAFDVSAGTFAVSGSMTVYFSDIAAVRAVRANEDVTLDMIFVKNNKGIVIDMPLVTLGDARAQVELDQPIMLPITSDAASGSAISTDLDHTLLFTFFDTLPDRAST